MIAPDLIQHEHEIVWLEDVAKFDYVRESIVPARTRKRKPRWGGRIVGYTTLRDDCPVVHESYRRVFWLMTHDRALDPSGVYSYGCPCEGVDPRTIKPGVPGENTERSWGGPL